MESFSDWLVIQLNDKGWSQAELSRQAGVSRAAISAVIVGTRNPGNDLCEAIARALKLPPETVFRAAGILPKNHQVSEKRERAHYAIDRVLEKDLDRLYKLIEAFTEDEPPPTPSSPKPTSYPSRKTKPARNVLKDK